MWRNWVFATNSDFLITISLQPNVVDLRYFKLWILLNQIIRVWNIKGLQHRVLKILGFKYLILLQRFNSFKDLAKSSNVNPSMHINTLLVWVGVCLFVSNKRQNGWTDRAQIFYGTSRDHRESLYMITNFKKCVSKVFNFVKKSKFLKIRKFFFLKIRKKPSILKMVYLEIQLRTR